MSTDPYPEVNDDESGIVPPQSARPPEWPKKLRTLSAAELDRLTIDGSGRFYWDGKLVNYEPPKEKLSDVNEQSAMDVIDRAVHDLGDQRETESIDHAELQQPVDPSAPRDEIPAVDFDMARPVPPATTARETHDDTAEMVVASPIIRGSEVMRLKLSGWQSFGAVLMVLGVLVGAAGMAAYGVVAAHDWGCRAGVIQSYCPLTPAARPSRSDIPA
jgi:hypothetical protein